MGSPCLWLTEGVTNKMKLKPGMKVLDMGCGKAMSSIFLAKEYGVYVFANDLWINPSDNMQRIRDADLEYLIFPLRAEAHSLPYPNDFFDAAISINAYQFFGTSDTYFNNYFIPLLKKGGEVGFALPGLIKEFNGLVPDYLKEHWRSDFYNFHSKDWWLRNFMRSQATETIIADEFDDYGKEIMRLWEPIPNRMQMVRADNGRNLTWLRIVLKKK